MKGMAAHSSILVWRLPWTEEPGRLQSMGLQRIGYDWAANTHTHRDTKVHTLILPRAIPPTTQISHGNLTAGLRNNKTF